MLGYDVEEVKKLGVYDIHPKESLEHVLNEFMAQAKGEKTLAENIPCLRKDGTVLYADFNAKPITLNGTNYNIGFVRDVTERKRAHDERILLEERVNKDNVI